MDLGNTEGAESCALPLVSLPVEVEGVGSMELLAFAADVDGVGPMEPLAFAADVDGVGPMEPLASAADVDGVGPKDLFASAAEVHGASALLQLLTSSTSLAACWILIESNPIPVPFPAASFRRKAFSHPINYTN
jgi:hypothetical protein